MFKIFVVTFLFASATLGDSIVPDPADEYKLVPLSRVKRLLNGTSATIEEFPYQVLILGRNKKDPSDSGWYPSCGGAIISKEWVLTAAHCVTEGPGKYVVRAGSALRTKGGTSHLADRVTPYPGYLQRPATENGDDIALVHVATPFEFDTTRKPIPLYNENEETKAGTNVVITGWGDVNDSGSPKAEVLQRITLPVIEKNACRDRLKYIRGVTIIMDNVICAVYEDGRHAACQGDSGTPATVNGRLVGVLAAGLEICKTSSIPTILTEVAKYRNWIKAVSGV